MKSDASSRLDSRVTALENSSGSAFTNIYSHTYSGTISTSSSSGIQISQNPIPNNIATEIYENEYKFVYMKLIGTCNITPNKSGTVYGIYFGSYSSSNFNAISNPIKNNLNCGCKMVGNLVFKSNSHGDYYNETYLYYYFDDTEFIFGNQTAMFNTSTGTSFNDCYIFGWNLKAGGTYNITFEISVL